jgi:DNA adenine methylase
MNSIIRWAGSKRKLLSKLKAYWAGGSTRYVEPFCGSACLFFDLEPQSAILGDLNSELITTYETLRTGAGEVCNYIRNLPDSKAAYYRIRDFAPEDLNEIENAVRFLYLNRYCFNGIYRTNQAGKFNVPRGRRTSNAEIDCEQITRAAELLKRAQLINADFAVTLAHCEKGDFVYLDPPYAVSDRKIFAEYHQNTFSTRDLERLAVSLIELDEKGAIFVVSYADAREARELLAPWNPVRVRTRRHIAGFAGHRRHAYEIIASNLEAFAYVE